MPAFLRRLAPDRFVLGLMATIVLGTLLPARGVAMEVVSHISTAAIVLLFFLHGARLAPEAVVNGFRRWRLQLTILAFGYGVLPALGLGAAWLLGGLVGSSLAIGLIYLAVLPTTVQSSIAYVSIARGNVAAAVIAAATSNLLGVVLTPLLVGFLASIHGEAMGFGGIGRIMLILLLPFALGQVARRWIAGWASNRRTLLGGLDRCTIFIAVYVAFSAAAVSGLWRSVSAGEMGLLFGAVLVLLLVATFGAWGLGRLMGFDAADRTTLLFAGMQKSLATGAPMARILFPGAEGAAVLLPLMIYHQLQLMLSALLVPRIVAAADADGGGGDPPDAPDRPDGRPASTNGA